MFKTSARLDFREHAHKRTSEVLFLAGRCDTVLGPEHQRAMLHHPPNARLEVIEDAGHFIFNDQPDAALAVVRAYLGQFEGGRAVDPDSVGHGHPASLASR
ncbi:MAG: alpha/beta fold hydrolase [Nannocystales bacterium]